MLQNDQVVTMNQFLAAAESEHRLDFAAAPPQDACGIGIAIGDDPARHLATFRAHDADRIARLETPERTGHARGEQALATAQRTQCARIDMYGPGRLERARDPLLARCARRRARHEPAAACAILDAPQRMTRMTAVDAHVAAGREG